MPLSCNLGTLISWNPLGYSRPVTGLLYLVLLLPLLLLPHLLSLLPPLVLPLLLPLLPLPLLLPLLPPPLPLFLLFLLLILLLLLLLLLLWRYNSGTLLTICTTSFHFRRSCTCSAHFTRFIFFRSFLTSSSHRDLGLPAGLPVNGFHLRILFTVLISGILFVCPNQLNLWTSNTICYAPVFN